MKGDDLHRLAGIDGSLIELVDQVFDLLQQRVRGDDHQGVGAGVDADRQLHWLFLGASSLGAASPASHIAHGHDEVLRRGRPSPAARLPSHPILVNLADHVGDLFGLGVIDGDQLRFGRGEDILGTFPLIEDLQELLNRVQIGRLGMDDQSIEPVVGRDLDTPGRPGAAATA